MALELLSGSRNRVSAARLDVYGLGNALVDFEYVVDDGLLHAQGVAKGRMTLVDAARMAALEAHLGDADVPLRSSMSGGSAANTVFAVRGFGGRGSYGCRLGDDAAGRQFRADLERVGIGVSGERGDGASGRCLTLVTADAERTMATCLGVSADLNPADVDEAAVAAAGYLYVEGYLAAAEGGRAAAVLAREAATAARTRTSLSLSDASMVLDCRDGLEEMLGNGVDHLFCNEEEALRWAGTDRLDVAVNELTDIAPAVNVTLGAAGSLAATKAKRTVVPGIATTAVDTTGAGDIYAGACLHAWTRGAEPADAARFANFAAAALVATHGARLPSVGDYAALVGRFKAS